MAGASGTKKEKTRFFTMGATPARLSAARRVARAHDHDVTLARQAQATAMA